MTAGQRCSVCNALGHNAKTCKLGKVTAKGVRVLKPGVSGADLVEPATGLPKLTFGKGKRKRAPAPAASSPGREAVRRLLQTSAPSKAFSPASKAQLRFVHGDEPEPVELELTLRVRVVVELERP
jgi:hypothetical protein